MPMNTAARAVVRSPGKAAPLGVLCLRVGTLTFFQHSLNTPNMANTVPETFEYMQIPHI